MAKYQITDPKEYLAKYPDGTYDDYVKKSGDTSPLSKSMFQSKENSEGALNSGIKNDKGEMSVKANPIAKGLQDKLDKTSTSEKKNALKKVQEIGKDLLEKADGKSAEVQKKVAEKIFPSASKEETKKEEEKTVEAPKVVEPKEEAKRPMPDAPDIKPTDTPKEVQDKKNAFLDNWAGTHPTLFKAVFGSREEGNNLTFGQRVSLLGSVLANIGANTLLGAQSGFRGSGFSPIASEWGDMIKKYSGQGIESQKQVQDTKAGIDAKEYINNYKKENPEDFDEIMSAYAIYSDNPQALEAYLSKKGITKDADKFAKAYSDYKTTELSESAKQKHYETQMQLLNIEMQRIQNSMAGLDEKTKAEVQESLSKAQQEMNKYNAVKGSSDAKTYNLEKGARYIKNVLGVAADAATTVGGIATGGLVGGVKDGIIKGDGTPQKIVKEDGTEIQLDPYDNVYATKNEITTEGDDGSPVIPMMQDDKAIVYQKKLGYMGNPICKDFEYYLNKLRG